MTRHTPGERTLAAGANLRAVREQRRLSQADLGARVGWTQSMIGRLEQGIVNMTVDQLFTLAEALKVKPARILKGID